MNAYEVYSLFLEEIFQEKILDVENEFHQDNHMFLRAIKTYKVPEVFDFTTSTTFTHEVRRRLERIKSIYWNKLREKQIIIQKLKDLTKDNWCGPYSELIAYDFLNHIDRGVVIDRELSSSKTFAQFIKNRQKSTIDVDLWNIFFEVKSFNHVILDLIDSMIEEIKKDNSNKQLNIMYELRSDISFEMLSKLRNNLILKLKESIKNQNQEYRDRDTNIRFKIYYDPQFSIHSTMSYSPYRHAKSYKYFVLNHFDQLTLSSPNILVYVVNPWCNRIVNSMLEMDKIFFRAFSRRIFCELIKDNTKLIDISSKEIVNDALVVSKVVKKITGILFLVDKSANEDYEHNDNHPLVNLKYYLYLNPNVDKQNSLAFSVRDHIICSLPKLSLGDYDDFEYDNY